MDAGPDIETQLVRLGELGIRLDPADVRRAVEPVASLGATQTDGLALLLVVSSSMLPPSAALEMVVPHGRAGLVDMTPLQPSDFAPLPWLDVPETPWYLLVDVDLGARFRDVTPERALEQLREEERTPLTIDEGVSLLLQVPDALSTRTAFSLAGSRRGDQRVPALWTSRGAPRLGWCWDRNPHSWLGTASSARRLAPVV